MELLRTMDAIFRPRSVALIGASGTPGKLGHDVLYNLIHAGFEGPIYPINPKAEELLGLKVYKDIGSTPEPADLAVVLIPARMVPAAIQQCGEAGVKAAIVVTGGFSEAGEEGEKLQEEMARIARQYGIRIIGPNCRGVNSPYARLCASWPLLTNRGGMAFVAQSGTVGAALMDWASEDNLGVSVFVSLGNRADVDESDCIRYFNEDPNTKVIALYMEGVKRPDAFLDVLSKVTKPVVILKAGRTAWGRKAAESHTKSMAGSDAIYDAIFRKYKVHRADTLEELYDFAKALAYMKKPPGKRLLTISSSGGIAILAIDQAENLGFKVPVPSASLQERLRSFLSDHCGVSNPVDLTGDAITDPSLYARVMKEARSEFDAMVLLFGDPIHGASDMVTPGESELVIFCGGADVEREETALMHQKGVPAFPTPERGIKALYQFFRFDETEEGPAETAPHAATTPLRLMSPVDAVALLKEYGIPAVEALSASSADDAVGRANELGLPVVLKVDSPDVSHKSDAGGVQLNLTSDDAVRRGYEEIFSSVAAHVPGAAIDGVTVSPMARPGGTEVIVGVISDPQYGSSLMFGLGGIFTEIYKDVRFCLLPAGEEEFLRMMKDIKGYPLLAGVRGQKPKDRKALIALMKALSRLVSDHPEIDQIDLNPVLVYDQGVSVVDYRFYTK
ncbi:MAG: acetate--CoA ligase family protein [Deltaproteobacteria bacterium]|nr:acetate--CoA ligase family protein [Deltaproteobacteria bacterium]